MSFLLLAMVSSSLAACSCKSFFSSRWFNSSLCLSTILLSKETSFLSSVPISFSKFSSFGLDDFFTLFSSFSASLRFFPRTASLSSRSSRRSRSSASWAVYFSIFSLISWRYTSPGFCSLVFFIRFLMNHIPQILF